MRSYLKVKIKSLAEEARIIRAEERRVKAQRFHARGRQGEETRLAGLDAEFFGLYHHRTQDVRREARAANIAYAFMRGRPYAKIEKAGSANVPVDRAISLVAKFGYVKPAQATIDMKAWFDAS
jgi:hypothetical protein